MARKKYNKHWKSNAHDFSGKIVNLMDGDWYDHGPGAISLMTTCWQIAKIFSINLATAFNSLYNAAPQLLSINNDYHNKYE